MRDQPLTFTIGSGHNVGTTVIALQGPLTLTKMSTLQNDLRTLQPPVLILDMERVPYMDSAGLGLLANAHVSAQNTGRCFLIAAPAERITMLLQLTQLEGVLRCFRSVKDAETAAAREVARW